MEGLELYSILVITILHAGHRHAVIVACAQINELKSNVRWLLVILNNECSIYGIDSEQNTLLNIMMMYYVT